MNVSSSSSSGGSSSESEEEEESPQWEVDHHFESSAAVGAPSPPVKRRRVQQQQPKVRVQPASAQYEDYGQYLQQHSQQGADIYEQQDTDDDLEVFYVPVRLPKGSRVSVPEGSFGRVDVEDQGKFGLQLLVFRLIRVEG